MLFVQHASEQFVCVSLVFMKKTEQTHIVEFDVKLEGKKSKKLNILDCLCTRTI